MLEVLHFKAISAITDKFCISVGILYVCIYVAIYEVIRGWGKPKAPDQL